MSDDTPNDDGSTEAEIPAHADVNHNISETADKIRVNTEVKRGNGTRDEDKAKVTVKGDDPENVARKVAETIEHLKEYGVAQELRDTDPERTPDDSEPDD